MRAIGVPHRASRFPLVLLLSAALLLVTIHSFAVVVTMSNDPKGFHNLAWGASLSTAPDLSLSRPGPHINEYRLKTEPPVLGDTPVDSLLFLTVHDQFARVTVRYRGATTHQHVMAYLERRFGAQERVLGQTVRGVNHQFNWQGTDTEINVTYDAYSERGFVFFTSRTLAPRFNDNLADTAE